MFKIKVDLCFLFQKCSTESNTDIVGKDHTHFMAFLSIYLTLATTVLMVFVTTTYKRRLANQVQEHKDNN